LCGVGDGDIFGGKRLKRTQNGLKDTSIAGGGRDKERDLKRKRPQSENGVQGGGRA